MRWWRNVRRGGAQGGRKSESGFRFSRCRGLGWPWPFPDPLPRCPLPLRFIGASGSLEGWQNGYCTGLENRRPKGLVGSNPTPSVTLSRRARHRDGVGSAKLIPPPP